MNSIDMLDECFDMIYKIRKTSLNKRINADNKAMLNQKAKLLDAKNELLNHRSDAMIYTNAIIVVKAYLDCH